jgi:hypothetical protein
MEAIMTRRIVALLLLGVVLASTVVVVGDASISGSVTRSLSALISGGGGEKGEGHGHADND